MTTKARKNADKDLVDKTYVQTAIVLGATPEDITNEVTTIVNDIMSDTGTVIDNTQPIEGGIF